MSKPEVKTLVIHNGDAGPLYCYEPAFLKRLLEKKPKLNDLTEERTLQFSEGELTIPLAKLRMCGDYFKLALKSGMEEATAQRIALKEISKFGFHGILHAIETEEFDFRAYPDKFKVAADYLQFHPAIEFPECILSSKECWGDGVDVLPTPELITFLNEVNPNTGIKWKDQNQVTVFWKPKADLIIAPGADLIITRGDAKNRIKLSINDIKIKLYISSFSLAECKDAINKSDRDGGYWVVMINEPQKPKEVMTFDDAEKLISDLNKELGLEPWEGFQVPSTLDAILGCFLHLSCSGEKKERILPLEGNVGYTFCKEGMKVKRGYAGTRNIHVGAVFPSGNIIIKDHAEGGCVGVCPMRKFRV